MKILHGFLFAIGLLTLTFPPLAAAMPPAAEAEAMAAARAADDERTAAMIAADRDRLAAILSDDLRYAHSNGKVDRKADVIDALVTKRSIYERFDYRERQFTVAGAGVVLMQGRVIAHIRSGEQRIPLDLNFLAVWRLENGRWRFLAWQSCRNPESAKP